MGAKDYENKNEDMVSNDQGGRVSKIRGEKLEINEEHDFQ